MRGVVGVRFSRVLTVALLAAVTAGASCNSATSSEGASNCRAACSRCGSELCVDCAATAARLRDEFENAVYACVIQGSDAASCDTVWMNCIVQAEGQLTPRPADTTYRDACLAKKSECDAAGMGFADDDCLLSPILDETRVAQAQQCLSQTCANIGACFMPLFN
jgi:hypothetical protein